MPFVLRPFHRVPVQRAVTYNTGPFQGQGTGWRLSGDLPMRPGDTLLFTVTLPNEQRIEAPNPHNSRRLLLQPPIRNQNVLRYSFFAPGSYKGRSTSQARWRRTWTAGGLPLGRSTYCWGLAPFFLAPVPVPKRDRHRHRRRSQSPGLRAPVSAPLPHPPPYYGGGKGGGPTNPRE